MRSGLAVGTDRADITPTAPVPLAGYAARAGLPPTMRVLAPLHVRTLAVHPDDGPPVVLVGADLLWWGDDVVDALRAAFAARFALPAESLVLHATHTHSGPQSSRLMTPSLGRPDEAYLARLQDVTLAGIERALAARTPVSVETARAPTDVSVDRRSARSAGAVAPSPIDRDLTLVRFADAGQETVAMLAHFACHPVIHHGNAVTSDLAGALVDQLERHTTPFAMYLQGCCGDVNPARYTPEGRFSDGGQEDVDDMAATLTAAARAALHRGESAGAPSVSVVRRSLTLPLQDRPSPEQLEATAGRNDVHGEWARLLLADPDRLRSEPELRLVRVRLTRDLELLGLSGEPVSRYGLHAKRISGGRCLPLGYTDGMTTYLVTAEHLAEGGYEPCEAPLYFGFPAPLAPQAEGALMDEITKLVALHAPVRATRGSDAVGASAEDLHNRHTQPLT